MTAEQLDAWRKAIAKLHASARRTRGRRSRDPWRAALPVSIKKPPARKEES